MSIRVYIDGEGIIEGATSKQLDAIRNIVNYRARSVFNVSDTGEWSFRDDSVDGITPYEDYIISPLEGMLAYAEKESIQVTGEFTVDSECGDYDNILIRIVNSKMQFLNKEVVQADTKVLESELFNRNKKRFPLKTPDEILAKKDADGHVEGYLYVHISDLIERDYEELLSFLEYNLVGTDELLSELSYEVVGIDGQDNPNTLIMKVGGYLEETEE